MATPVSNTVNSLRTEPYYLGSDGVASRVKWTAAPDSQTEILVADPGNSTTVAAELCPVILTMIGQIRSDRNYLTIDGLYNPDHPMPWQLGRSAVENLLNGTATCLLGPVPALLPEANSEWARCVEHIEEILRNVLPMVNKTGFFAREDGRAVLKFVHKPFEARDPSNVLPMPATQAGSEVSSTDVNASKDVSTSATSSKGATNRVKYNAAHIEALEALDGDREPEFRTVNVPAHPRIRDAILDLAHTHMFNPLCAFMHESRDSPIIPAQYGTVLPGAVVRISFTLSHRLMRRPANVSHFTATINEIEVLHRPIAVSMTPDKAQKQKMFLKRRRIDEPIAARDLRKRARN